MTTTKQIRREIRNELGLPVYGRTPLRARAFEEAFDRLGDDDRVEQWSAAKTRFVTLATAHNRLDKGFDREPYAASQPCTKAELMTLKEALDDAAEEEEPDEEPVPAGGDD